MHRTVRLSYDTRLRKPSWSHLGQSDQDVTKIKLQISINRKNPFAIFLNVVTITEEGCRE